MTGHIEQKGNRYYVVLDYGTKFGKRNRKWVSSFDSKEEALLCLNEYLKQKPMQIITVEEFLYYWLDNYVLLNDSESTYERYEYIVKSFINYVRSNMDINNVNHFVIQQYYNYLFKDKKLSKSTIQKTHRVLNLAFKHAVQWKIIKSNPFELIKTPKAEKIIFNTWDISTANSFLEKIEDDPIYLHIFIAIHTGMRLGEICALRWCNINFINKTISVTNSLRGTSLSNTKTENSIRVIYMDSICYQKLQEVYQNRSKKYVSPNSFVCCDNLGNPINSKYVSKRFSRLVRKHNFPLIRFHDLRHSFATLMLSAGVNPKIVSEILGHSSVRITLDIYSHVLPTIQKGAMEKFEKLWLNVGK